MPKLKHQIIGKYVNEKSQEIFVTAIAKPKPRPCKHCKKEPRQEGSSACKTCGTKKKVQLLNDEKLRRRIGQASN